MNKKGWLVVAGVAVLLGGYVYRTYPRHVAMTLHGVQYRLGSHGRGLQQVTLTLNGTRDQPISGPETFYGTVDISGATFPDHGNGQLIKLQFVSGVGDCSPIWIRPPNSFITTVRFIPIGALPSLQSPSGSKAGVAAGVEATVSSLLPQPTAGAKCFAFQTPL